MGGMRSFERRKIRIHCRCLPRAPCFVTRPATVKTKTNISMRNSWKILLLLAGFFVFDQAPVLAQNNDFEELTKEEKKEWKKVARQYRRNLAGLKTLVEEHDYYEEQTRQLQAQVNDLNSQLSQKERQVNDLQDQIADLNQRVIAAETAAANAAANQVANNTVPDDRIAQGIVFRVQVGAYEKRKVDSSLANSENLSLEDTGNIQRIMIGQFRGYDNAMALRDHMRTIGVSDAFIVAYNNGTRIDVEEARKMAAGQ